MTNITEANTFPATVTRYDTTDPVLGGLTGESNEPIITFANRTRFLYNYVNGHADVAAVTANTTIDTTFLRKLIYVNISANITLTITAASNLLNGQKFSFIVKTTGVKCAGFTLAGGDSIINLPAGYTGLWLHDGEHIELEKIAANTWWLHDIKTNLNIVGNDGMVRFQPQNAVVANGNNPESGGALSSRADFARYWNRVNTSGNLVNDATWLANPVTSRQLPSSGNGSTTFRFPDMRSISWRGLDMGRNLSITRLGIMPGSYEADRVGPHKHPWLYETDPDDDGLGSSNREFTQKPGNIPETDSRNPVGPNAGTGSGTETIVKNAGLIPVIYY